MPTQRKKFAPLKSGRPRKDPKELTERRYHWLASGVPELLDEESPFSSEADEEICYRANKEMIMDRWFSTPSNYCYRPDCWWRYEEVPRVKILGYHKWWSEGVDPGSGWTFSPMEEPDFFRIEGDIRDFERPVFDKLKSEFLEQCEEMRGQGILFDSLKEVEAEKEKILRNKVVTNQTTPKPSEALQTPEKSKPIVEKSPAAPKASKYIQREDPPVVICGEVCWPIRIVPGTCSRCGALCKKEFCWRCGCRMPEESK